MLSKLVLTTFIVKNAHSIDTAIEVEPATGGIFPEVDPDFALTSFDSTFSEFTELYSSRNRRSNADKNRYFCETNEGHYLNHYSGMGIIPIVVKEAASTAGEMVYLGLSGNNLNHDVFRFAPTSPEEPTCLIEYPIFDSNTTETCQNPLVSLKLDYKNKTWRVQHMLFVIANQQFKENGQVCDNNYKLVCNVKLCTNEEENSVCDQVANNCLVDEESRKEFLCSGREGTEGC